MDGEILLRSLFHAAVFAASDPARLVRQLPAPPKGRTVCVGAGKGAAAMARAVEDAWAGELSGLVVTRYEHGAPTRAIEVIEAGHPHPDQASERAGRRILALAEELGADDQLLCLLSGGGSALMAVPADGLTMADKRAVTGALLRSGATIAEINCVRKHLSSIKGGRLAAAAHPAATLTLAVSDVPGDDPAVIASGPTIADPTTVDDARRLLADYHIDLPPAVASFLAAGGDETPKRDDPRLARSEVFIVATPQDALEAAAAAALEHRLSPLILGDAIEGEARHVARVHAGIVRQILRYGQPVAPPCVLLSGGETTVTVTGQGRGGRNAEFLLALAIALDDIGPVYAIACDTDGIDGVETNAGALLRPDSTARARALGLDARAFLANNDAYGFFDALDDLVVTGPTRTNVNDFRAILVGW